jgi:hypothetical protein
MIEVYARRANAQLAADFTARLRAEGHMVSEGNSGAFRPEQADPRAWRVYHDGEDQRIPATYEALGITCEIIPDATPETAADGYRVEKRGVWYTLYSGEAKVGKAQKSEADAWALRGANADD